MAFPSCSCLEVPILQELKALGGESEPRQLYHKLVPYFPQLTYEDLKQKNRDGSHRWKRLVYRAGQNLVAKHELERTADGKWRLTEKGRQRAQAEDFPLQLLLPLDTPRNIPSHKEIKEKLLEIGRLLGKHAEEEYQKKYDVVWKDSPSSPRISHVFEVQCRGNIESALAKLKHAHDTQRSQLYLILADRKDSRKLGELLHPYLAGSFHEISEAVTILTPSDVDCLHRALSSVKGVLEKLIGKGTPAGFL